MRRSVLARSLAISRAQDTERLAVSLPAEWTDRRYGNGSRRGEWRKHRRTLTDPSASESVPHQCSGGNHAALHSHCYRHCVAYDRGMLAGTTRAKGRAGAARPARGEGRSGAAWPARPQRRAGPSRSTRAARAEGRSRAARPARISGAKGRSGCARTRRVN